MDAATDSPGHTHDAPGAPAPQSNRATMLLLAYLWILAFVPLVVAKDDPEVQWHARHGLVLFVVELILWAGASSVAAVLLSIGPFAGSFAGDLLDTGLTRVTGALIQLLWLALVVLHVTLSVKAVRGTRPAIPGIRTLVDRL